jgi:peptide-methionine (S)-S-oxide reductase
VVRTRVGYSGGAKSSPTYHDLGDHTEAFEIDFDEKVIAYGELVRMWSKQFHGGGWSKQYQHLLFVRDDAQKKIASAETDARAREAIIPFKRFWRAENYHQKYYLRHNAALFRELKKETDDTLADSTLAARLNGFAGGFGTAELLDAELSSYALSPEGERAVRALAMKKKR